MADCKCDWCPIHIGPIAHILEYVPNCGVHPPPFTLPPGCACELHGNIVVHNPNCPIHQP